MIDLRGWFLAAAVLTLSIGSADAQNPFLISTTAGGLPAPTAVTATSYPISLANAVVTDRFGHTYFSTTGNSVFRLDPSGYLSRVAGTGQPGYSGDGNKAVNAQLSTPEGLAVDLGGNLYIADLGNQRIRLVTPAGIISTIAGTGVAGYTADNVPATTSELSSPQEIAMDSAGNLYIADQGNNRIRKVTPGGTITTYAGTGTSGSTGDGGPATGATLNGPISVAVDYAGNLYIGDASYQVRRVSPGGTITHVAGIGFPGDLGDNGPASSAQLGYPSGLATDAAGNIYVSDQYALRVRKISPGGIITLYAGGGSNNPGDNGPATSAQLNYPGGLTVDYNGNLYIADQNRVRKVGSNGQITTAAGTGGNPFGGDGAAAALAQFSTAWGIARDHSGNFYVADAYNCRVRKIATSGVLSTFAGTGTCGYTGDTGQATAAEVNPFVLATDPTGNVYLDGNAVVRKIDTTGNITTVAGNGTSGYNGDNMPATSALLALLIRGLAVDSVGNLYISDYLNFRVRKVSGGTITTVAGNGTTGNSGDGALATSANLGGPSGLAIDGSGNLYIADSINNRVRKVVPGGNISNYAGNGTAGNTGDGGLATSAELNSPTGLSFDSTGNLYIATHNNTIRMVNTAGVISNIAGTGGNSYTGDGGPATSAQLSNPVALVADASTPANVYVADTTNAAVRVLTPGSVEPLLLVNSTHSGNFSAGEPNATYTLTVTNAPNAGPTAGQVTVTETLPPSLTLISMTANSPWSCSSNTCSISSSLAAGNSYPEITVTANVAGNAPPQVTNQVTVSGGGSPETGAADAAFVNLPYPVLDVALTHSGSFIEKEQGTYTVFIGDDVSAASTSGAITVTENLPGGLTLGTMSGNNWICSGNSCSRGDSLPAGTAYDPVTIVVNVAANAPNPVINQVTVSGGGATTVMASDTTTISSATCDVNGDGVINVADVQAIINQVLGSFPPTADLNHDGKVNIVDVQIVINAVLGFGCPF